jgi:hypothetical protein
MLVCVMKEKGLSAWFIRTASARVSSLQVQTLRKQTAHYVSAKNENPIIDYAAKQIYVTAIMSNKLISVALTCRLNYVQIICKKTFAFLSGPFALLC